MVQESALQGMLIAGVCAWLLVWLLKPAAVRLDLLDHPQGGRKAHHAPTPVTGGVAMTVAALVGGAAVTGQVTPAVAGLVLGMLVLLVMGIADDLHDLRWWWRLAAQAGVALVLVYLGDVRVEQLGGVFGFPDLSLGVLSVPLTVIATVGLINAINLIDGVDGLAGSLTLSAFLMLTAAALYAGNKALAAKCLVLAGAVAGFLAWNFPLPGRRRAAAFMGNSGSALLGLAIAWVCFRLTQNPGHPVSPVLALWLLPVPVMDCLVLIVRRLREGRSPFSAGRDHVHHLMRDAGFGPFGIAVVLSGFTLACGLVAGQAMRLDVPNVLILAAYGATCVGWYWLSSRRERAVAFFARLRTLLLGEEAWKQDGAVLPASNEEVLDKTRTGTDP